jgi:pyrroline-5-carboxylate reductase
MPHLPATIGQGMTVAVSSNVNEKKLAIAEKLFTAVGNFRFVEDEKLLNPVTAISGSGPAYIFYFAECLIEAAEELGCEKTLAHELVMQTLKGSAELAVTSDKPVSILRQEVTSKGGTTEAALTVFDKNDQLKILIKEAVKAATKRAEELAIPGT